MLERTLGGTCHPYYGGLISDCRMIIMMMDTLEMPDVERAALLQEALAIMKAKDVDTMRVSEIMTQLGKQLGQLTKRELNRQAERHATTWKTIKDDPTE